MSKYFIGQKLLHVISNGVAFVIKLDNTRILLKQISYRDFKLDFEYEPSLKFVDSHYIEYQPLIDIEYNET